MKISRQVRKILIAAVLALGLMSSASAALIQVLGNQAVYDSGFNITWVADANLAASNNFGVSGINANGTMTWFTAQNWIDGMNASNYLGFNDWRLPTTAQPDPSCSAQGGGVSSELNCSGSELGHLFYTEFGVLAGNSVFTGTPADVAKFSNFQSRYWSGTTYAPTPTSAWYFDINSGLSGLQRSDPKNSNWYGLAVRSGDVSVVPLPGSIWLLGSGLLGMLGVARRRR